MKGLEISGLTKNVGRKTVLSEVELKIEPGRIVGLLGPNGAGKSTLLRIVAGLEGDYRGQVLVNGHTPGIETKGFVSYLPDRIFLPGWMKSGDAVAYFADFFADFDRDRVQQLLKAFRIDERLAVREMSRGMCDKLQIALVFSRKAKIFLLDEPLGSVDPVTRNVILDTTLRQFSEDSIVVFATHMIREVERIFDSVVFLDEGKVKIYEDVETIRETYGKGIEELFEEVFACSHDF